MTLAVRDAMQPGVTCTALTSGALYEPAELPFESDLSGLPNVFSKFRKAVEQKSKVRKPLPAPEHGALPLRAPEALQEYLEKQAQLHDVPLQIGIDFLPNLNALGVPDVFDATGRLVKHPHLEGGESTALARLHHYLWETDCVASYYETRNGMLGLDYSSKLSPWFAHGCLSPSMVAAEVSRYEKERLKNKSTYWLVIELMWRDFLRLYSRKWGNAIFYEEGPAGIIARGEEAEALKLEPVNLDGWTGGRIRQKNKKYHAPPPPKQHPGGLDTLGETSLEMLERWKAGRTGVPLVDANMRELAATGYMSSRGRQCVASYLTFDLGLDWRAGADHFESLLIDYDVTSNWANWIFASGRSGKAQNRYNIVEQSKRYDPQGASLPDAAHLRMRRAVGAVSHAA